MSNYFTVNSFHHSQRARKNDEYCQFRKCGTSRAKHLLAASSTFHHGSIEAAACTIFSVHLSIFQSCILYHLREQTFSCQVETISKCLVAPICKHIACFVTGSKPWSSLANIIVECMVRRAAFFAVGLRRVTDGH